MILIADSGSTKTDWALTDTAGKRLGDFETQGLNPYQLDEKAIESAVRTNASSVLDTDKVSQVFFYGAGCSSPEMSAIVNRGLQAVFPKAEIQVDHDQTGSAYSTYDGRPCISCILGTGSNSCYFDGNKTYEEVPSLAYVLGDEASGSYFGKILLREYFYKRLPDDIRASFDKNYSLTISEVLSRVYKEPKANVFLAGFMKFIGKHAAHPHVVSWIVSGMKEFIDIHVKCYSNWKEVPVHFVGSVAYHFEACLRTAAGESGIQLGRIIKKPIDGLVEYHIKFKATKAN